MLGLWMLETLSSPLAEVVTASFAVFPSDPGAPLGHRAISAGGSAARSESGSSSAARSACGRGERASESSRREWGWGPASSKEIERFSWMVSQREAK